MFTKSFYLFVLTFWLFLTACAPASGQEPTALGAAPTPTISPQGTETAVTNLPEALVNHTWQLTAAGEEAADMFLPDPPAWLRFSTQPDPNEPAGYSFEGYSGCNTLFGAYTVAGEKLTMSVGQTEQGCDPDLMAFEGYMVDLLRQGPTFAITSENGTDFLALQLADDASSRLIFVREEVAENAAGCSEGGIGVFTPEDVRCILANTDPAFVRTIDEDTAVLFTDPAAIADWVGGAIIYHIPTISTLVLDRFGDVDPQFSRFNSRAGLASLSETAGNAALMADLKQQVQTSWETAPTNEPEIRLSAAWQDGQTTIFLIAIAGLAATDDRFYCAGQTWTIDDVTVEIVADCIVHEAGTPVHSVLFESQQIKGSDVQLVQMALNGVWSNELWLKEGSITVETAVYQTILQALSPNPLLVRGETAPGNEQEMMQLETAVAPDLLQNYQTANETPTSLRFLFPNSDRYFVNPSTAIELNFLPAGDRQQTCAQFRTEYAGLGGVVTLSRIGMSEDGKQALVHALLECGSSDYHAAYYTLVGSDTTWQIINEEAVD